MRLATAALLLASVFAPLACQGGFGPPPVGGTPALDDDDDLPDDDDDSPGDDDDDSGANCGDLLCKGHSKCQMDGAVPQCVCDRGYFLDPVEQECVRDESCVQVRPLRDHCRQSWNGPPAVAAYFSIDFCSGDPIVPETLTALGARIVVEDNGVDVTLNEEASARVLDKDVESFVDIVLDVSGSFTGSGAEGQEGTNELVMLIPQLTDFVNTLRPAPDGAPVYVGLHIFGRAVVEYVPITNNLDRVVTALQTIAADPKAATTLVNGDGSSLYLAVEKGIHATQRMREFREAVTSEGVLTTGAVVVITDGRDNSGGELNTQLISETLNNVISIGVGFEINDGYLDPIGKDGSYLAPNLEDWVTAFAEITQRVEDYPHRAYLLGFCSSASVGEQTVHVRLEIPGVELTQTTSGCRYSADNFAPEPAPKCDVAFFEHDECATHQCGGMSACGACPDSQCCDGDSCMAPLSAVTDCDGDQQQCAAANLVCTPGATDTDPSTCQPPAAIGEFCDLTHPCLPTRAYCDMPEDAESGTCVGALEEAEVCADHLQCTTLHCAKPKESHPVVEPECLPGRPGAPAYWPCDDDAECEEGTYCDSVCVPRHRLLAPCTRAAECHYGECRTNVTEDRWCRGGEGCFYSWNDKHTP